MGRCLRQDWSHKRYFICQLSAFLSNLNTFRIVGRKLLSNKSLPFFKLGRVINMLVFSSFLVTALCISSRISMFISSAEAKSKLSGHPSGAWLFLRANGGIIHVWLIYEYNLPEGTTFDKTVDMEKSVSTSPYFIPALFGKPGTSCPFAARFKKICVDQGRDAGSCSKHCISYAGSTPVPSGSTRWRQRTSDKYRSCRFWGYRCKNDSGVEVLAYGETGKLILPASLENAGYCGAPF